MFKQQVMCSYLYLLRSPCAVVSATTNCKTCKTKLCKKNMMSNSPHSPQKKVYKNPRYYQFRKNNIRIQHELTTKKSKRNCDTKQQTEALSQPLSFCQKIWWSTCVKKLKQKKGKEKNKLFEFDCVTNQRPGPCYVIILCLRKGRWTLCAKPKKIYAPASHCAQSCVRVARYLRNYPWPKYSPPAQTNK